MGNKEISNQQEEKKPKGQREGSSIQASEPPVSLGSASTDNKERVLLSRAEAEVYAKEQQTAPENKEAINKDFAPSNALREIQRLHEQLHAREAKNASLTKERDEFRNENDRLKKENRELKDREERRLQQARDSYIRQRQQNPEEYKDKRAEYMREYRKRKKQQAPSPKE